MITLDRAIELMEAQVGELSGVTGVVLYADDILHYLRAFRDAKDALEAEKDRYAEAVRNCEKAENKYRKMEDELNDIRRKHIEQMKNDPLTMEYFSKQIDTEPIWCEKLGEWYLFLAYDDWENEIQLMSDKGDIETFNEEDLGKYPLYRMRV